MLNSKLKYGGYINSAVPKKNYEHTARWADETKRKE